VSFWKGLRVLVGAVLADKRGESVISESFLPKVNEIISKPYQELLKMEEAIAATLANRGGSSDAFWNYVKNKIEERKREHELGEFYSRFKETHQEEAGQEEEEEAAELD
jgi:hypothetical protein